MAPSQSPCGLNSFTCKVAAQSNTLAGGLVASTIERNGIHGVTVAAFAK